MVERQQNALVRNASLSSSQSVSDTSVTELVVFRAGGQLFAVHARDVSGTAERKAPARLPLAPRAVLGVISVRGRILTLLDPLALLNNPSEAREIVPFVVILRGDDQLALAADQQEESVQIASDRIRPISDESASTANSQEVKPPILGTVRQGDTTITVLDPAGVFAAAMGGLDRRRRRT
jgi:purine-binding chemotaxis protein CheW